MNALLIVTCQEGFVTCQELNRKSGAFFLLFSIIIRTFAKQTRLLTTFILTHTMNTMQNILLFGLGGGEILLIALVVLLLFGGKKIPELMKGLGKGVKSFKDGMKEIEDAGEKPDKDE